jgi:hypothetical protein
MLFVIYAEYHNLLGLIMLNIIILSVVMLRVIASCVFNDKQNIRNKCHNALCNLCCVSQ